MPNFELMLVLLGTPLMAFGCGIGVGLAIARQRTAWAWGLGVLGVAFAACDLVALMAVASAAD